MKKRKLEKEDRKKDTNIAKRVLELETKIKKSLFKRIEIDNESIY